MVKENSRKENEQKLFKNFSSKEEMQRMRESVSADVLYQENYKFLRYAMGTLKTASSTAEYRQILYNTNRQHFPERIQGKMPEIATEHGSIVHPFVMEQVGGRFNRATVVVFTAHQNTIHRFVKVVKDDPANAGESAQKLCNEQMKLVNHINNTIVEATNLFTTSVVKGVAGNLISDVEGDGTGYNTRSRQQKAKAVSMGGQTTPSDTSEIKDDNSDDYDSLYKNGIKLSSNSVNEKFSSTLKVIVGCEEVIKMAKDELFNNEINEVEFIINNEMVQQLDMLRNDIDLLVDGYGSKNPTQIVAYNNRFQKINTTFEHNSHNANATAVGALKSLCSDKLIIEIEASPPGTYDKFKDLYEYVLSCQEIPSAHESILDLWRNNIENLKESGKQEISKLLKDSSTKMVVYKGLSKVINNLKDTIKTYEEICSFNGKVIDEQVLGITAPIISRYYKNILNLFEIHSGNVSTDVCQTMMNGYVQVKDDDYEQKIYHFELAINNKLVGLKTAFDLYDSSTNKNQKDNSNPSGGKDNGNGKKGGSAKGGDQSVNVESGSQPRRPKATDEMVKKHLPEVLSNFDVTSLKDPKLTDAKARELYKSLRAIIISKEDHFLGKCCSRCAKVGVTKSTCDNCNPGGAASGGKTNSSAYATGSDNQETKGFVIENSDGGIYMYGRKRLLPGEAPFYVIFDTACTDLVVSSDEQRIETARGHLKGSSQPGQGTIQVQGYTGAQSIATVKATVGGERIIKDANSSVHLMGINALLQILSRTDPEVAVQISSTALKITYRGEIIINVNIAADKLFYADFNMISKIIFLINDADTNKDFSTKVYSTRSGIKFNAFEGASISAASEVDSI